VIGETKIMRGGTAILTLLGVLLAGCQSTADAPNGTSMQAPEPSRSLRSSAVLPGPGLLPAEADAWFASRNDWQLGDPRGALRSDGEAVIVTRERLRISNGRPSSHSTFSTFTAERVIR
jgi:hypothetical protein